jgi:tetratricopeptide (TPR) repeat protein
LALSDTISKSQQYEDVIKEAKAAKNNFITMDVIGKPVEIYSSIAYKETKDLRMAFKEAELAQKYNPNRSMNYNNIATFYMDMRDYEKGYKYCQMALKMTPKFQIALKNMAACQYELKKYKECAETIEKIKDWKSDLYFVSLYNYSRRQTDTIPTSATPAQ